MRSADDVAGRGRLCQRKRVQYPVPRVMPFAMDALSQYMAKSSLQLSLPRSYFQTIHLRSY